MSARGSEPTRVTHPDVISMPVGQVVGRMNEVRPVADVMADLVRELDETVSRLEGY